MPIIRLAEQDELSELEYIYFEAMMEMHRRDIPQWSQDYPACLLPGDIQRQELFVIEDDHLVVGALVLNQTMDEWLEPIPFTPANAYYIHRLAIDPIRQGRGYARMLMEWAHMAAQTHGGTAMRLDTNALNIPALRLYEKLGYRQVGSFEESGGTYIAHELLFEVD